MSHESTTGGYQWYGGMLDARRRITAKLLTLGFEGT